MGRSAKLHKRIKKSSSSSTTTHPKSVPAPPSASSVQPAKKRADLKSKVKAKSGDAKGEHVLGGADYVTLLLGGRRKAEEEALKLPDDNAA